MMETKSPSSILSKGYSTPEHLAALRRHGASPHHRATFAPVREVLYSLF
jgi:ribonuclease HII